MHEMAPPFGVQFLMHALAFLLGAGIGRALFAPRFPETAFGLTLGFAPIGWILGFVGAIILGAPTDTHTVVGPRPIDWRGMEYMAWSHAIACIYGVGIIGHRYKFGHPNEHAKLGISTFALGGACLFMCFVLINVFGWGATTLWSGFGWLVLPLLGYQMFMFAMLFMFVGVLRNQISNDGPSWLGRST